MLGDFVGFGALNQAFAALDSKHYRRVLIVASREGWNRFNPGGPRSFFMKRETEVYSEFSNNPEFSDILRGAARFRDIQPDLILAIGGGSAIDVAKMIKAEAFTRQSYDASKPESIKPSGSGPALVAIATTAGSGSEATQFAVFYLDGIKQSVSHPSLRPEMAVVDPELTYSLSPCQTAATGFDALSQAVEAYWASAATSEAREFAAAAIKCIIPNIRHAVHSPAPSNRYFMAHAAHLAGKAINITRTTMPHALGYHLTKRYDLPHGHACAISLPYFFVLNTRPDAKVIAPCGEEEHRRNMEKIFSLLGQKNGEDSFVFWRDLMHSCGLVVTWRDIGLATESQMRELIASMNQERMRNHPVAIDAETLVEFFRAYKNGDF
ncbi:MAG: phosphonoacetaldehyde reductase [Planctomycetes bacterium]|nr:phosphonoacetaldehyde reductase [Planctomycetota bacterium]